MKLSPLAPEKNRKHASFSCSQAPPLEHACVHPAVQRTDKGVRYGPHTCTLPGPRGHKPPFAQDSPRLHLCAPFHSQRCLHLDKKKKKKETPYFWLPRRSSFSLPPYVPHHTHTRPFCLPHQNEVGRQGPCQAHPNSSDPQQASDNKFAKLHQMLTEES